MHNQDIKQEISHAGLKLWQIADKLNLTDGNFSRKLRKELTPAEKENIRNIIADLLVQEGGGQ